MLIQLGDRGPAVTKIQRELLVTVTGVYDAATQSAVSAYQTSAGLTATGTVDLTTWWSLFPDDAQLVAGVEIAGTFTSTSTARIPTTKAVAEYVAAHGGGGGGGGIATSLATAADQGLYSTAANTWAVFSLTSAWRTFLSTVKAVWTEATGVLSVWGLQVDTAPSVTPTPAVAQLQYDDTLGTITFLGKGGNVTIPVGSGEFVRVKNDDVSSFTAGTVVYLSGSDGINTLAKLALASTEARSATTIGVVAETIAPNNHGWVQISGMIRDINTSALTAGALVWLSATTPGGMVATEPVAPNHGVQLGLCVRQSATVGAILLSMQNGYELNELHNVRISSVTTGDLLTYDGTIPAWKNAATIAQSQVTSLTTDLAGKLALTGGTLSGALALTVSQAARTAYAVTNTNVSASAEAGTNCTANSGAVFFGIASNASSRAGAEIYTADPIPVRIFNNGQPRISIRAPDGEVGIGVAAATAALHLKAGTSTAGTAPLKLTSGTILSTPEAGAVEYNGTNWFLSTSSARRTVAFLDTITTSATPVSVPATGGHVRVIGTAGAKTVTLPATSGVTTGTRVTIKDAAGNAASGTITVNAAATELIDGASSATITTNYGVLRLIYSGSAGRWETC